MVLATKGFFSSKTIWGSLIAMVPAAIRATDWALNSGVLPPNVAVIVSAAGAALAMIGRVTATKEIKGIV